MYMLHRFVPIQEQYQFINEFKKLDLNQNGKLERE